MTEAVLELRNLTKRIGRRNIVDNLTFDIPAGEVFGFLGPNGAGKTTTIRMIVGLISMTKGEVRIKGVSVKDHFELAMTHVGAIVENPEMYKFLTGYQNLVHFARRHSGVTKQRIDEVVSMLGLQNRIHEKVKRYSLGMRQRLGVAQAILHRPSLLILDEPTNGLDPAGIRELRDYLRKLTREEGISVIVSSHLLSEMELMCDRVAIIQSGKLVDVRSMQDASGAAQSKILLEAGDPAAARQLLSQLFDASQLAVSGPYIEIAADKSAIPNIARVLVAADIEVLGIHSVQKSLEDQFLEITGGEMVV
ncbi:ABC transporter ATP-binding protein [Cohnella thailandensis]|uniref:ABC transporter ATP-binding protein n=1 Tax=Cohnella thailandensis TaxID=557557 RepID=A0A841T6I0_9BACL|nr:ABC transporter ATP-binding protein [Cohnella thailandensis]MBB6637670.1 ABC transporter ATP-binding protein [Cohnella thailandensis]MBP1974153.1 ABC-2 type transport system ATP-binding protein [Cohnella thailandensis]